MNITYEVSYNYESQEFTEYHHEINKGCTAYKNGSIVEYYGPKDFIKSLGLYVPNFTNNLNILLYGCDGLKLTALYELGPEDTEIGSDMNFIKYDPRTFEKIGCINSFTSKEKFLEYISNINCSKASELIITKIKNIINKCKSFDRGMISDHKIYLLINGSYSLAQFKKDLI